MSWKTKIITKRCLLFGKNDNKKTQKYQDPTVRWNNGNEVIQVITKDFCIELKPTEIWTHVAVSKNTSSSTSLLPGEEDILLLCKTATFFTVYRKGFMSYGHLPVSIGIAVSEKNLSNIIYFLWTG